jgi:histidinol-phosphate phosphatase family protein
MRAARDLTTVVVPTIGRPSLYVLLDSLRQADGACPDVVVVDDRPDGPDLELDGYEFVRLVSSGGRGPATARNHGWRDCRTPWISFLDDDVVVEESWIELLQADLSDADDGVVATQGRVTVPLPTDRRPTDAERGTAGLESARWITADMSVRTSALVAVGGFDQRFRRAYREDSDLGLRLRQVGRIERGTRGVLHPVRPEDDWFSLRQQRGNADDTLMWMLHGPRWRELAGAPRGALRLHRLTTGAALSAVLLLASGRRAWAGWAAAAWAGLTARFAWARIAPGPRDRAEVRRMALTSAAIPFAATYWAAVGRWRHRAAAAHRRLPALVLFDRDGTLVHDVPYNRDPELVQPVSDAAEALGRLRDAGIAVGVVTNQSGVGRGRIGREELAEVNARVDELLGPFDTWQVCVHVPDDGCACRKPRPGLVVRACRELDVRPEECVVIGDIGADVQAAERAGAIGILVPNDVTQGVEIDEAQTVKPSLSAATATILRGAW